MKSRFGVVLPPASPQNSFTVRVSEALSSLARFLKGLARDGETWVFSGPVDARFRDAGGQLFNVICAGAVNDGWTVQDAVCTAGSVVVTSAIARWSSTDVGKAIFLGGTSLTSTEAVCTTIAQFDSPSQIRLALPSTYTGTGQRVTWGTDNTNVMRSVVSDHRRVFLPEGAYVITGSVAVPSNTRIEGAGRYLSTIHYFPDQPNEGALWSTGAHDASVEHLGIFSYGSRGVSRTKVHYTYNGQTMSGCAGVRLTNCDDCRLHRLYLDGGGLGISAENTIDSYSQYAYTTNARHTIEGCLAFATGGGSFYFTRVDDSIVRDCHARYSGTDGFKWMRQCRGIKFSCCSGNFGGRDGCDTYDGMIESTLSALTFRGNTNFGIEMKGLFDEDLSDYVTRENTYNGIVTAYNGDCGVSIVSVHNATITGLVSIGDCASPFDPTLVGAGIRMNDCANISLNAPCVSRGYRHGIAAVNSSRLTITAPVVMDNSWVDGITQNGQYHGIYFDATSSTTTIVNSRIGNSVPVGTAPKMGGQANAVYLSPGAAGVMCIGLNGMGGLAPLTNDYSRCNIIGSIDRGGSNFTGHATIPYTGTGTAGPASRPITRSADVWVQLSSNNASPSVAAGNLFYTANTAPTLLQAFGQGVDGQAIEILVLDGFSSLANNAFVKTNTGANKTLNPNSVHRLRYLSATGIWYEQ